MEENQKKTINLSKKTIIGIVIAVVLVLMIIITALIIGKRKEVNYQLGNISNMGLAASNEEGTFYNKYEDGIVKVKGLEELKITNETAYSITPKGDEIYYLSIGDSSNIAIKKVKTNGSGMQTIKTIHTSISKMYIESDNIFYAKNDTNEGIVKLSLDGKDERTIVSADIKDFEVVDGKLYYSTKIGDLYVGTAGGTEIKKITPEKYSIKDFQVKDNWVYYFNEEDKDLRKVKTDGTNDQQVSKYVNSNIYNVAKDRIYFFNEESKKIASINFNGDNYKEIVDISTNKTKINVVGDTIYYLDASNNESKIYQMYRVKTNGGRAKAIQY